MKHLLFLSLLLLTACKQQNDPAKAAEAEALDYVRLVSIAAINVSDDHGQPIPATRCDNPIFAMHKTTKFLKTDRCTVKVNSDQDYTVAALFNGNLAVVSDVNGTRKVKVSELPEVK